MKDLTGIDLAKHPQAIRVRKKPLEVTVTFAAAPGTLQTLEGRAHYGTGDALLTGTGENDRWPVRRGEFLRTYAPVAPTAAGEAGRYVKRPLVVHALPMREHFRVRLPRSHGVLFGKPGDWLLQYGRDQHGIVSADVFDKTYTRAP